MTDLSIHPVYLSARAAIVSPEKAIPVTVYFAQKWLPRLGSERWSLILLLRAMSVEAQRRGDGTKRVTCSWRQISDMLGVHEETVSSWLKHEPIPSDKPWRRIIPIDEQAQALSIFIPRLRYAYETKNGKTRRIGFLLEVLMEDPVVEEDQARLKQQIELLQFQQGSLNLETYRQSKFVPTLASDLPDLSKNSNNPPLNDSRYVNTSLSGLQTAANPVQLDLHNGQVNQGFSGSQPTVKQDFIDQVGYVNPVMSNSAQGKPSQNGTNVNQLDILIQQLKQQRVNKNSRREAFYQIVQITEHLLEDTHSTAMLYKVLNNLYPERIDLYVSAVRIAVDAGKSGAEVNKGAIFVKALKDFADIAGVELGLKSSDASNTAEAEVDRNPGSYRIIENDTVFATPDENQAVWAETQAMLRNQMTKATYDAIIQGTSLLKHYDNQYIIGVQSEMARDWLANRLKDVVQRALSRVLGYSVIVSFELVDTN